MKPRNLSLDVVRGIAIILVLIRHVPGEPTSGVLRAIFELGWTGVDLFFVLSGYLISLLLYKEMDTSGTIKLSRFWLRRGLKIWPSYLACFGLMVAGGAAFEIATGDLHAARNRVLASLPNLIFIQNYTGYWWPHSWSLAIEEHFYLLLPLTLIFLLRRSLTRKLPVIIAGVCVVVALLRIAMYAAGWHRWQSFYYPTHLRLDALAFGVLLGHLHRYQSKRFYSIARYWPMLLAAVLFTGIAIRFPLESSKIAVTIGFTVLYLSYGALVLLAAAHPEFGSSFWPVSMLAWCGVYSYTIYLAHSALSIIPAFSTESVAQNLWLVRVLFWALSIAGGVILSHLVERPFLRWRQRLYPSDRIQPINVPHAGTVVIQGDLLYPGDRSRER
jgi:peptidoglycan/LPS O-acetylase OafA/YrhL